MVSTFASRAVLFRHCIIHRSSWVIVKYPYRVHSFIQTAIEKRISSGCLPPPFFLFMKMRHEWWVWQSAVVSTDWLSRSFCSHYSTVLSCYCCCFSIENTCISHQITLHRLKHCHHWLHALGLLHMNDCPTFCTPIMSVLVVERRDRFSKQESSCIIDIVFISTLLQDLSACLTS